jgi:hypothetical protein
VRMFVVKGTICVRQIRSGKFQKEFSNVYRCEKDIHDEIFNAICLERFHIENFQRGILLRWSGFRLATSAVRIGGDGRDSLVKIVSSR